MAESLHTVLSKSFAPKLDLRDRENLSIKEKQTTYKLSFGKRRASVAYQVDGNIISDGNKCDYLILARQDAATANDEKWKSVFVELKATDVEHAVKQLDATLKHALFKHPSVNEVHARLVAKSFPANNANPAYEKAKRQFKKNHPGCTFKQVTSGHPDRID